MEFEKDLDELRRKIEELSNLPTAGKKKDEISRLKGKLTRQTKDTFAKITPWNKAQVARHPQRPYTLDYIDMLIDDFVEFHGDRRFGDDPAIVAGFGRFEEWTVAIVGQQKGRDTKEKLRRNFGMPHPEGYRKALRVMKMAENFRIPILTLVDTPGAYPGIGAEERGQAEAIATNIHEMSRLRTPIIVTIAGEGGSGGALAIAVGDRVYMLEHSIYSVISPEGCSSILWRSQEPKFIEEAANNLHLTAQDLMKLDLIDDIIPEPLGAAHQDWKQMAESIRKQWVSDLSTLCDFELEELMAVRYRKFRKMGIFTDA